MEQRKNGGKIKVKDHLDNEKRKIKRLERMVKNSQLKKKRNPSAGVETGKNFIAGNNANKAYIIDARITNLLNFQAAGCSLMVS
jgi:hypothetical protein